MAALEFHPHYLFFILLFSLAPMAMDVGEAMDIYLVDRFIYRWMKLYVISRYFFSVSMQCRGKIQLDSFHLLRALNK